MKASLPTGPDTLANLNTPQSGFERGDRRCRCIDHGDSQAREMSIDDGSWLPDSLAVGSPQSPTRDCIPSVWLVQSTSSVDGRVSGADTQHNSTGEILNGSVLSRCDALAVWRGGQVLQHRPHPGNFDRFVAAGGRGTYHALDVGPEGHGVWRFQTAWGPIVDAYLNLAAPVAVERQRVPSASSTPTKSSAWPTFQARLSAGAANTSNLAVLPTEQPIIPPAADVPAVVRGLSGRWTGWVGSGARGSVAIAVEQMSGVTAIVAFSYADATTPPSYDRQPPSGSSMATNCRDAPPALGSPRFANEPMVTWTSSSVRANQEPGHQASQRANPGRPDQ